MLAAKLRSWLAVGTLLPVAVTAAPAVLAAPASEQSVIEMLPPDTAMAMVLDTRLSTWAQLGQFELFQLGAAQFETSINPGTLPYLPFAEDYEGLSRWAGPMAVVALLPLPRVAPVAMDNHIVMAVPVTDPTARDDYLQQLQAELGPPERQTYRGVPLLHWPETSESDLQSLRFSQVMPLTLQPLGVDSLPSVNLPLPMPSTLGPVGLAIALMPDTLVAAENPTALQRFLDQRPRQASLAENPQFQRSFARLEQRRALGMVYGDLSELLNYSSSDLGGFPQPPVPSSPLSREDIQTLQASGFDGTLEALLYPQPEGLRFQGRLYFDDAGFTLSPTPARSDGSLLAQLPAATYGLVSGYNLAGIWQQITLLLENFSATTRDQLQGARSLFTLTTGLDLDEDVFGWMDGEFALFAFPSERSPLTQIWPDLHLAAGLMLETSDRKTADATLSALNDLAAAFQIPVAERTVNGAPVTSLEPASLGPTAGLLSYGWVRDDILALTSGSAPMGRLINPIAFDPLSQHSTFLSATAGFPSPNDGYFYFNAGASLLLAYHVLQVENDPARPYEFIDYLNTLRSLSFTSATTEEFFEFDAMLGLASKRRDAEL